MEEKEKRKDEVGRRKGVLVEGQTSPAERHQQRFRNHWAALAKILKKNGKEGVRKKE